MTRMMASQESTISLSIIVPVYNRPAELDELLRSLSLQTDRNFEVIIVDDGSAVKCDQVVENYRTLLNIKYFYKENTGPGLTRNYGAERAGGNYTIYLDSDCVLPNHYVSTVLNSLSRNYVDAFGGPDSADQNFSVQQKAINYAMTSFFTTGGIRGGGEKLDKFHPRSFNMGFSKKVFEKTGGFPSFRFAKNLAAGEDLDLSIQIGKLGFKTALIKDAYVFHKRRTNFKQFFNQVFNFGYARISIYKRHPESLKLFHFLPAVFFIGCIGLVMASVFISIYFLTPLIFFMLIVFTDSTLRNRSMIIGAISVYASFIQLFGYGAGFLKSFWQKVIFSKVIGAS
jgi:glycosyltransferase involved in cell wall biosynthesis